MTPTTTSTDERWGYCEQCQGWIISTNWGTEYAEACPRCGKPPEVVERSKGTIMTLEIVLTLPADAQEPAF